MKEKARYIVRGESTVQSKQWNLYYITDMMSTSAYKAVTVENPQCINLEIIAQ